MTSSLFLNSCQTAPIKIYVIRKGVLTRDQANEFLTQPQSEGFFCTSPADTLYLLNRIKTLEGVLDAKP